MENEIEILQFIKDVRGFKIGYVDFCVKDKEEKWKKYRNWAVFVKDDKKWISEPKVKRDIRQQDGSVKEQWVAIYESNSPIMKNIYANILSKLEEEYL